MALYRRLDPLLARLDPEWGHRAAIGLCAAAGHSRHLLDGIERAVGAADPRLATTVAGLEFASPVGLAAGFDKNARAVDLTSRLGFGFIEIGSVSERRSLGNPQRPRVWRLPADEALRVFYGCPSDGAAAVAKRLQKRSARLPVGVNLVETNTGLVASAEHAADEIARALGRFIGTADFLVLNLSCPNTLHGNGGRFDDPKNLGLLLSSCAQHKNLPSVFLKITPPGDPESPQVIESVLEAVDPFRFMKGFILNIPNRNPHMTLRTPAATLDGMRGGITGPSLRAPTNSAIAAWYGRIDTSRHALIGVGGIASAADAYQTIKSGAALVQLYTALVYRGPGLVKVINTGLAGLLQRDGLRRIGDAVGQDARRKVSPRPDLAEVLPRGLP